MIHDPATRRRARLVTRAAAIGSAVMCAITAFGVSPSGVPAAGAATSGGALTVITPDDGTPGAGSPITSGDDTTPFSLRPPSGGACTGDTATDGYFLQSFIVPVAVDPASLTFDAAGPLPQGIGTDLRQPLLDVNGSPFVDKPTLANPGSPRPKPGEIVDVPAFDFALFPDGSVPTGSYVIGLACTKGPAAPQQLDRYFTASLDVVTDPADPGAFTWSVAAGQVTTTTTGGTTSTTAGSTTAADGSTTTTTTTGGSSVTSAPSGDETDVLAAAVGPSGTPLVGGLATLPATGGSVLSPLMWAGLLLVFGRMAVLLGRPPSVLPPHAG
ncbi:MAG: hypothetical protein ACRDYW_03060 [Acidimicrobiales bacterium]